MGKVTDLTKKLLNFVFTEKIRGYNKLLFAKTRWVSVFPWLRGVVGTSFVM